MIYYLYDLREPNFFFNFKLNSWQPNFSLMWLKFPYEKSFLTRITNSEKFDLFLPSDSRAPLTGYINEMKIGIIFDRIILIDRSDRNAGGISLNISQFQKKRRKYVCTISFKFPLSYTARADRAYRNCSAHFLFYGLTALVGATQFFLSLLSFLLQLISNSAFLMLSFIQPHQ